MKWGGVVRFFSLPFVYGICLCACIFYVFIFCLDICLIVCCLFPGKDWFPTLRMACKPPGEGTVDGSPSSTAHVHGCWERERTSAPHVLRYSVVGRSSCFLSGEGGRGVISCSSHSFPLSFHTQRCGTARVCGWPAPYFPLVACAHVVAGTRSRLTCCLSCHGSW